MADSSYESLDIVTRLERLHLEEILHDLRRETWNAIRELLYDKRETDTSTSSSSLYYFNTEGIKLIEHVLGKFRRVPEDEVNTDYDSVMNDFKNIVLEDEFERVRHLIEVIANYGEKSEMFMERIKNSFEEYNAPCWLDTSRRPFQFVSNDSNERVKTAQQISTTTQKVGMGGTVSHLHGATESHASSQEGASVKREKKVFIGHGHSPVWLELKNFITERLNLPVDEFNRVSVAGETTVDRLKQMLDEASVALLVMTGEDEQSNGTFRARENVVHEAGFFQGRLGFRRAVIVLEEGCEQFSNVAGLGQIKFPKGNIEAVFEKIRLFLEREESLREQKPEPLLQRAAWEISGARTKRFKLYVIACRLSRDEPAWPLPTEDAREEYNSLRGAIRNDQFGDELAREIGFKEGQGREHELEIDRKLLRKYLQAMGRPVPEFLEERFDDAG